MTGNRGSKVSPDVIAAHLEGEAVLLHLGTKQYYRLNETSAAIWKGLERGLDEPAIVAELTREFDVAAETAEREVHRALAEFEQRGLMAT